MGSEWKEVTLGDLFKVKHGFAFKGEFFTDEATETVCVTPGNFAIGGGFQNPKPKYYNGPVPEEYILTPGQVVVTMTDLSKQADTLGFAAIIPDDEYVWLHNQRVGLLEFKDEIKTDPQFISYLLRTHQYRSWVIGSASGTTVKHTSPSRIESYSCFIPPYDEQVRIGNTLAAYERKIALNRQINTTLESMAQALFKSWFVDFDPVIDNALAAGHDIPEPLMQRAQARAAHRALRDCEGGIEAGSLKGEESEEASEGGREGQGDSNAETRTHPQGPTLPADLQQLFPDRFVFTEDMGWVPEGWEVKQLSSMIELIGGGTPKTSIEEYWGGDIPWFSVVDAPNPSDVFVLNTEKSITQMGLDNSSAKLLAKGTTIISARGTVGKCAVVARPMAMNQSCYGVRGAFGNADYFTYYMVLRKVHELQQRSHGSVFSTITRDTFKGLNVASCSPLLTQKFDALIGSHMDRILSNIEQIQILSNLRDSLLPKLLSGQITIPDAEQALDEVL